MPCVCRRDAPSESLPVRGAWIEIGKVKGHTVYLGKSLPVRGAWIEISWSAVTPSFALSLPVRGAWIEMES